MASLLKLAGPDWPGPDWPGLDWPGLDWPGPDFSTLCRRQKTLAVQLPCRGSGGPLHLPVDSTGIKVRGIGEWHARKHGGARRRVWRKLHFAADESTLEVRAVEGELASGSGGGDAPVLPDLLRQVPADEPIASGEPASADGACGAEAPAGAVAGRGAEAVIPPRRNAKPVEEAQPRRPGEERGPARHQAPRPDDSTGPSGAAGAGFTAAAAPQPRRSRAETKTNCMKRLGPRLMAVRHRPRTDGGSMPHLPPTNRQAPNPHRHPQPLRRTRHPRHAAHQLTPAGERGTPTFKRSVQQSPFSPSTTAIKMLATPRHEPPRVCRRLQLLRG